MTDAELLAQVMAGRAAAFTELLIRHHAGCLRFARHLLGDPEDAEEVVQDTFVRAYQALGRYRERDSFRSWLFQILVNRCRTAGGRRRTRQERFVRDDGAVARAAGAGGEGLVDVQRQLVRALDGLDTAHREAFLLKVGEELEYDEIARLTGASVPALKMRVKRARDHVRARWEDRDHA